MRSPAELIKTTEAPCARPVPGFAAQSHLARAPVGSAPPVERIDHLAPLPQLHSQIASSYSSKLTVTRSLHALLISTVCGAQRGQK